MDILHINKQKQIPLYTNIFQEIKKTKTKIK
jgi:hypothetical protein